MKLIVISSPDKVPDEISIVLELFREGLQYFHVRKPRFTKRDMTEYIEAFPENYRNRLVLHSYHQLAYQYKLAGVHLSRRHRKRGKMYFLQLWFRRIMHPKMIVTRSFHKLTDLTTDKRRYAHVFLSPIFDSISNSSLSAGFSKRALLIIINQSKHDVLALGGVRPENMKTIFELGFAGAAMLGAIWKEDHNPVQVFCEARDSAYEAFKNQRLFLQEN